MQNVLGCVTQFLKEKMNGAKGRVGEKIAIIFLY